MSIIGDDQCVFCKVVFYHRTSEALFNGKCYENKLKLSAERIGTISKVVPKIEEVDVRNCGICKKCYRKVLSLIKSRAEFEISTRELRDALSNLPSKNLASKRVLSPENAIYDYRRKKVALTNDALSTTQRGHTISAPCLLLSDGIFPERYHVPSICTDYESSKTQFGNKKCRKLTEYDKENQPVVDDFIQDGKFICSSRPILPHARETPHIPLICTDNDKHGLDSRLYNKVRKSLCFDQGDGEVEIRIKYKSGMKTVLVNDCIPQKIAKLIFHNRNVEEGILNLLIEGSPEKVSKAVSTIIDKECKVVVSSTGGILGDKSIKGIVNFDWNLLATNLQKEAPNTIKILKSMAVNNMDDQKILQQILFAFSILLHSRNRTITAVQYVIGMVLLHGGCTHRDIERLSKLGICVVPKTLKHKLQSWQESLDEELLKVRDCWVEGSHQKYQLVGDNWDKNILPSYRTSQSKTQSLHLFNVIGVLDRIECKPTEGASTKCVNSLAIENFVPSLDEQLILRDELTFLVARAVVENIGQVNEIMGGIYPNHLNHKYSDQAGLKTKQFSLGLFDCDERKTADVIKLMKNLSERYVPQKDGEIIEEVFFGGDRLTDERIQCAQKAMENACTSLERLEGFISKIEDFHRLMNFLEAISKITYCSSSARDRGSVYYYRNLLNARNIKGEVKNAYRAYKLLYYTIFDAMCCVLFLKKFEVNIFDGMIPLPEGFTSWPNDRKISWINSICKDIVQDFIFEDGDPLSALRDILQNPEHIENYWVSSFMNGKFKCHFCDRRYTFLDSLRSHEKLQHSYEHSEKSSPRHAELDDEVYHYLRALFSLVALHKNLDSAVNMGDGPRSVRSAKYETPLYHKTNKTKYFIGSVHLTGMTAGTLPEAQTERLIANRFINISGGKNNNMALDEYVELLNRDTKNTSTGYQTKESLIDHSKEFPYLIDTVKNFDKSCEVKGKKGFHKLPSYQQDVKKVFNDLIEIDGFSIQDGRKLGCRQIVIHKNPFSDCAPGFPTMVFRHRPILPFRRLRNNHI